MKTRLTSTYQRSNPTPEEQKEIDKIIENYRYIIRWGFRCSLRDFPKDLRIYGRILLEQVHAEGIALKPEEWQKCVEE